MPNSNQLVFSVTCDRVGTVIQVLRDDRQVLDAVTAPINLRDAVDEASSSKVWRFLEELNRERAAAGWTFNVMLDGNLETLHFAGGALEDCLLVVAAASEENISQYYEELLQISNEHANALRAALKETELARRQEGIPRSLYQEMMQLNNELTNTQRELAKRNHELDSLNSEKNRFLGMAAHDLRTPLNVVFGYSELLRDEWEGISADERNDILGKITSSGRYMLSLVDGFLDYSKIESGTLQLNLQQTTMADVIASAIDQVGPLADVKQIKIHLEEQPGLPLCNADFHRMSQVILNLLTNAIKYSEPGATTRVRIKAVDHQLLVEVEDEGAGIPADQISLLFQPFSRTTVRTTAGEKSTGMGLLIVKRIVEAHGGTVGVKSTRGKGSTFWIRLPAVPAN